MALVPQPASDNQLVTIQLLQAEYVKPLHTKQQIWADLAEHRQKSLQLQANVAEYRQKYLELQANLTASGQELQQLRCELAEYRQKCQHLRAVLAEYRQRFQQSRAVLAEYRQKCQQWRAGAVTYRQKGQEPRVVLNSGSQITSQSNCHSDVRLPMIDGLPSDPVERFRTILQLQSDADARLETIKAAQLDIQSRLGKLEQLPLDLVNNLSMAEGSIENAHVDELGSDMSREPLNQAGWEKVLSAIVTFVNKFRMGDCSEDDDSFASDTQRVSLANNFFNFRQYVTAIRLISPTALRILGYRHEGADIAM